MPLITTVVGAYPKPQYVDIPDWFTEGHQNMDVVAEKVNQKLKDQSYTEIKEQISRATEEVIKEQTNYGIDIITDGEIGRENYIFHFCRHLKNFDFEKRTYKEFRNGACKMNVPTVRGPLEPLNDQPWCVTEWKAAQALTNIPVKYTLPGPMTIRNTTHDAFYNDEKKENLELIRCINKEVRALSDAGCAHIQVDEPLLVRDPDTALDWGIEHLEKCFEGVGPNVTKTIHLCCGYPNHLDEEGYLKADLYSYIKLAAKLDNAIFDAVSIEDAHRHNDLSALLPLFKKTVVIFGVVTIANSKIETVADIKARVEEALKYIPKHRLWLAPDCGLGFLPKDILERKIKNMVESSKMF